MSDNHTKINSKPQHGAHSRELGLLLSLIIFMAWLVGISLLLSLMSCQPNEPINFIIGISSL
ncbi:hypothetical protein AAIR29_11920 [Psychrobacter sp. FBL11]|uniref:Uncharacterized protein n=1 Tax=Psychrobacter saeujeotis TaxID=3143436 RepID=A0ABU9XE84_9GAMM